MYTKEEKQLLLKSLSHLQDYYEDKIKLKIPELVKEEYLNKINNISKLSMKIHITLL